MIRWMCESECGTRWRLWVGVPAEEFDSFNLTLDSRVRLGSEDAVPVPLSLELSHGPLARNF